MKGGRYGQWLMKGSVEIGGGEMEEGGGGRGVGL